MTGHIRCLDHVIGQIDNFSHLCDIKAIATAQGERNQGTTIKRTLFLQTRSFDTIVKQTIAAFGDAFNFLIGQDFIMLENDRM